MNMSKRRRERMVLLGNKYLLLPPHTNDFDIGKGFYEQKKSQVNYI
jgi:hypothetical protein